MSGPHEKLARLRRYNLAVQQKDPKLAEESRDTDIGLEVFAEAPSPEAAENQIELESIAMRRQRPVLAIRDNVTKLVFIDEADSEIWGERLKKARPLLDTAIPAVGRIDLTGAQLDWVGTGWLVANNIIVTNRHVANEFATRRGDGFAFRMGLNGQISADVTSSRRSRIPTGSYSSCSSRCTSNNRPDPTSPFSRSKSSPATVSSPRRSISRPASPKPRMSPSSGIRPMIAVSPSQS